MKKYIAIIALLVVVVAFVWNRERTNIVFDISLAAPLADGRPVVEIKSNGTPIPNSNGPLGSYLLLVRKDGDDLYTRQFTKQQATTGVKLDLAIGRHTEVGDHLTVAVEDVSFSGRTRVYTRLSNRITVPVPPKDSADFSLSNPNRGKRN